MDQTYCWVLDARGFSCAKPSEEFLSTAPEKKPLAPRVNVLVLRLHSISVREVLASAPRSRYVGFVFQCGLYMILHCYLI